MIQRSKIGLKFFSPAFFDAMFIFGTSQSKLIREVMRDITVALPAQQRCAQTISANVLKLPTRELKQTRLQRKRERHLKM